MILSLNGNWKFRELSSDTYYNATVPGCNFTDLMANNLIPDPFIGASEKDVQWVGDKDWEYIKEFELSSEDLSSDIMELVAESLDTMATVFINDYLIITASNAHRTYNINIKPFVKEGDNIIKIIFLSPVKYIAEGQKLNKYPYNGMGLRGAPHIRKNQSHFGWDWGPILPLSGVTKNIYIKAINKAKIVDVRTTQEHYQNRVKLNVDVTVQVVAKEEDIRAQINLIAPDGRVSIFFQDVVDDKAIISIDIENPELWEANGMSERVKQPLYQLEVSLKHANDEVDVTRNIIGLRTITLNTTADKWGDNFQFIVNGVPIFARGANWIPADSFATRLTVEKIDYLVKSAKDANMNMIRVWGGGFYESEEFYDACDRYGILVWQDFGFACMPYDFDNPVFIDSIRLEVIDNILRLRNRASLALWCGNNEIELMSKLWINRRDFIRSTGKFFYEILPEWVGALDNITPYWPGSPSSNIYLKRVNSDSCGDTHLWQVWHGLKPYNYYRKRFSRFCSEFGFESLPDIETVVKFADDKDHDINSDVMLAHQKCTSGNAKILYYITERFRIPDSFDDLIYLSQISQMECVRDATEHWRRNMLRCNGALYWQLNDCWPVNSWSSIDYYGRWKALHYEARKFNAPIALSINDYKSRMRVSFVNDRLEHWTGIANYKVIDISGNVLDEGMVDINAIPLSSEVIFEKDYKGVIDADEMKRAVFAVWLNDDDMSLRTALFDKEKNIEFLKPNISRQVVVDKGLATITLKSDTYARYVMVKIKGVDNPMSDNYFDLLPNVAKTINVDIDRECTDKDIVIEMRSLGDLEPKQSRFKDNLLRWSVKYKPINILFAIGQLFS